MIVATRHGDPGLRPCRMHEMREPMFTELEEPLKFERLIAEISGRFVNLPADKVDGEIRGAQRRMCEFLGLDRSSLGQVSERESKTVPLTHIHQPPGSPLPERLDGMAFFPWTAQTALAGQTVIITKLSDLPPEAARDRESFSRFGTKSVVVIPLSLGESPPFGILTFSVLREERDWPETVVKGFLLLAQVFANALDRKRTDEALRESEARLSLATHAAGVGLWGMTPQTGHVWVTPKTRELFHFKPDEALNHENFFRVIHHQDRERVILAVLQAVESGQFFRVEYRIVLPDRSIRWVVARGQRYRKSPGEPDCIMGVSLDVSERKGMEEQLKRYVAEIEELKQRIERENIFLREEVKLLGEHTEIVGQSLAMKRVLAQGEQVARTNSTTLIMGETGTGKELLARAIHQMSERKDRPLVAVNCASLPPTLIESELFGREKGAYTGAMTRMSGRFEIADGSTLLLDEIGELPPELQSKLLRVLQEGSFERLGSAKTLHVDVRIIATTNRDLEQEVKAGRFRKDLFYRLSVFPIVIPPLRERPEDIPFMVWAFVKEFEKKMGKEIETISKKNMEALQSHSWPGNGRELRNVVEHAMILSKGKTLVVHALKLGSPEAGVTRNLEDLERRHIVTELERSGWRVAGKGGAAEVLGLKRSTLYSKMKKLGIGRPRA
jgi:formate hydrogenlyase transcriptional activator